MSCTCNTWSHEHLWQGEDVLYPGVCVCSPSLCSKDPRLWLKLFLPPQEGPCRAQRQRFGSALSPLLSLIFPWATDRGASDELDFPAECAKPFRKNSISQRNWFSAEPWADAQSNHPEISCWISLYSKPLDPQIILLFQRCSKIQINPAKGNQNSFSKQKFLTHYFSGVKKMNWDYHRLDFKETKGIFVQHN